MHMQCSKIGLKMLKRFKVVQYTVHPLTKLSQTWRSIVAQSYVCCMDCAPSEVPVSKFNCMLVECPNCLLVYRWICWRSSFADLPVRPSKVSASPALIRTASKHLHNDLARPIGVGAKKKMRTRLRLQCMDQYSRQ